MIVQDSDGPPRRPRPAVLSCSASVTLLRHLVCVLALMWTGLVNGQPFFFSSDTTNYIRAADAAIYVASRGAFRTLWSDRYRAQIPRHETSAVASDVAKTRRSEPKQQISRYSSNDLSEGVIMGGRSPYIGALMYFGYVTADFWPFVFFQALVAYLLIVLTARRFGVTGAKQVTAITLGLAATTSLPTYNSLLLADAFASFGMLAFLLVAMPGKLSRWELIFLVLVMSISVTAHLSHIMILMGMVTALALLARMRLIRRPPRRAWLCGIGAVLIGFASVQITAEATKLAFGRAPQLLPLLTARLIADGPGKRFIDAGCDGNRFQICHVPIGDPTSDALILFGPTPQTGAYMMGNAQQRLLMGQQDTRFAFAVFRFDPSGVLSAVVRNTLRQLLWIDYGGLNQNCFSDRNCWGSLPSPIRAKLRTTPSGQGLWPQAFMNVILYAAVLASLLFLVIALPQIARDDKSRWLLMREWLSLAFVGMFVSCFFGGAVADPQYRYQGRLIWIVPLIAGISYWMRQRVARTLD